MFAYAIIFLLDAYGRVVQLVRTPACHAGGRGFEPLLGRQYAAVAQSVERILGKDEVTSSNLVSSSKKRSTCFGQVLLFLDTWGIKMLGRSTRKGDAASVGWQSRQRLRSESALRHGPGRLLLACGQFTLRFCLRQNARTAQRRRRPEGRSGDSPQQFCQSQISILTVSCKKEAPALQVLLFTSDAAGRRPQTE